MFGVGGGVWGVGLPILGMQIVGKLVEFLYNAAVLQKQKNKLASSKINFLIKKEKMSKNELQGKCVSTDIYIYIYGKQVGC